MLQYEWALKMMLLNNAKCEARHKGHIWYDSTYKISRIPSIETESRLIVARD